MRSDMAKVIVERPRLGRGIRTRDRHRPDDDSGWREPAAARVRRRTRHLNENLAPLRRFLHRQVGRPWDRVYGEIRARIDARTAVQLHVLQHLEHFVTVHVDIVERVVRDRRGWALADGALYVCPRTGILRTVRRRIAGPTSLRAGDEQTFERVRGEWYLVAWAPAQPDLRWDVLRREHVAGERVAVSAERLTGRALRRVERALARERRRSRRAR